MSLRGRCTKIFSFFHENKKATVRGTAAATGIPKSSVQRHKKGIERRNRHPESLGWETEAGQNWLIILLSATLYIFGIRGGIGMETICEFFQCVRLEKHLGVSPSSLQRLVAKIEKAIGEYKEVYEKNKEGIAQAVVGADETFFDNMILVLIELSSGYILFEEPAEDRTYETWKEKALGALESLGLKARYMVSDNAKALTKLALSGIQCSRILDLFHATNEIVKVMGARFANKAVNVQRKLSEAIVVLELLIELGKNPEQIQAKEQLIEKLKVEQEIILKGQSRYYEELHNFSKAVHPFSTDDNTPRTTEDVERVLLLILNALGALAEEYEIKDNKKGLDKVKKQIQDIASLIDLWWVWVRESITHFDLNPEKADWLLHYFLPVIYWQIQLQRTSSESLHNAYEKAYQQAQSLLDNHPLTSDITEEEIRQWQSWAQWIVMKFQRTSSAVEGRNGTLSRMNHNQRSISPTRLKTLTVVHNFGIKRQDGTTAAERLFGKKFPDIFEWILERMRDLPMPRKRLLTC
jgi:tetratricopeptide (TPR) repeat protein